MENYDIEYTRYCLKSLFLSLEDKIDNEILTKEEFIKEIETKKAQCYTYKKSIEV